MSGCRRSEMCPDDQSGGIGIPVEYFASGLRRLNWVSIKGRRPFWVGELARVMDEITRNHSFFTITFDHDRYMTWRMPDRGHQADFIGNLMIRFNQINLIGIEQRQNGIWHHFANLFFFRFL